MIYPIIYPIYSGLVTQTGHYHGDQEQDNADHIQDNAEHIQDNADHIQVLSLKLVTIRVIRNKIMLITLLMMINRDHECVDLYQIYSKCSL